MATTKESIAIIATADKRKAEKCDDEDPLMGDDRSVASSSSNMSTVLQSERLIFKYPDGTYAYAFRQQKNKD